jgi:hypothetical protein
LKEATTVEVGYESMEQIKRQLHKLSTLHLRSLNLQVAASYSWRRKKCSSNALMERLSFHAIQDLLVLGSKLYNLNPCTLRSSINII